MAITCAGICAAADQLQGIVGFNANACCASYASTNA